MNYMEGMSGPIHFSEYAGKEIAMGGARKWSVDDIAGYVAVRCERQLPANASPLRELPAIADPDWLFFTGRNSAGDRAGRVQRQRPGDRLPI